MSKKYYILHLKKGDDLCVKYSSSPLTPISALRFISSMLESYSLVGLFTCSSILGVYNLLSFSHDYNAEAINFG